MNYEKPVSSYLYGFSVDRVFLDEEMLILYSFSRENYPHPEAPEQALLSVLVRKEIARVTPNNPMYPVVFLMFSSQENIREMLRVNNEKNKQEQLS